jgi:glucokinase
VSERLVGIDVGGTKMLAVAVGRSQPTKILVQHLVSTPTTAEGVISSLIELAQMCGAERQLGIGLAGLVEDGQVLRAAPNLQCMIDVPVRSAVERALGVPVLIDNDATCALVAEMTYGVAQESDDAILVTLGTGIGGGVAIGGSVRRGAHGFAGEPGHMCVNPSGPLCVCGRNGCWERYASGSGVVWLAQQRGLATDRSGDAITGEALADLARGGDAVALEVWAEFAEWLARGLANLADVLDPELFVIGGGLVSVSDLYLERTRELFVREVLGGRSRRRTRIEPAQSGPLAGAIGAALLH